MSMSELIDGLDRAISSREQGDFEAAMADYLRSRGWYVLQTLDELRTEALAETNLMEPE